MNTIRYEFARPRDEKAIKRLLTRAELPSEDIGRHLRHMIVAWSGGRLICCVDLELHREFGLLRSLAVAPDHRGKGLGRILYERIIAYAHLQGIKELRLLTNTAEGVSHREQ